MRKIVYPAAGIIITFLIFFLISMSMPSDWAVQRRIYINEKPAKVLPYVQNLDKWKTWNKWATRRGINSIALTCRLSDKTTCVVAMEGNREIENCLIMLVPSDFGVYAVIKVEGKIHENPLRRFLISFHDRALGAELEKSLKELKSLSENKK